jgi:hypothetical protein
VADRSHPLFNIIRSLVPLSLLNTTANVSDGDIDFEKIALLLWRRLCGRSHQQAQAI